jgi:hypothetical protein
VSEAPRSQIGIEDYLQFPNVKVVAIIRDGNDTIASMMTRGKKRVKKAARRWSEAIETIHELKRRFGARVLVVAFDDLILHPEATLQNVCAFLGIGFQMQMLDGHKYNPYYPEAQLLEEKAHARRPEESGFRLKEIAGTAYEKYRELYRNIG